MRKSQRLILIIAVVLLACAATGGLIVANDLSKLRSEVRDIDYKLGDLENALRGSPNPSTHETVRLRVNIIRDDLRLLSSRHQLATAIFRGETTAVWERFGRVEQRSIASAPRR